MTHTKDAYWLEFLHRHHPNQYLTLSELLLIKGMLNEGRIITRLERVTLSIDKYKKEFGI